MSEFTLIHGDCLDVLPTLRKESIDMILCDLPYGITANKWDSEIPLGLLWNNYKRIIKPNGAIVLTASQPFTSTLVMSNLEMFKYEWIWCKNQGSNFASVKYQPMKEHESVLVFGKNRTTYNPIMQPRAKSSQERFRYGLTKYKGDKRDGIGNLKDNEKGMSYNNNERNPSSYQFFNVVPRYKGTLHPTQKPVALFEYLIRTYTNEGDLVLDNCIGSGTTMEACQNLNRSCIGIELNREYCEIAAERCHVEIRSLHRSTIK